MTHDNAPELLIFGCGKMGIAMLSGALQAGWPARAIAVAEPNPSTALADLQSRHGFSLNPHATSGTAKLVLLSIKPQMLDAAADAILPWLSVDTVIVSIMAGKSIADLARRFPMITRFVRAMPNTPAAIGRGITGAYATATIDDGERARVQGLLETTGRLEWLSEEAQIDAVTAISGSGPAYVFNLVEALALAGTQLGLKPDVAARLARATIEGAGELLYREGETSPAQLRQNVTSPGGTTAAALEVLMAPDGLAALMMRATAAAHRRAGELAG
jgi:pyrroline-5-carboxylate reductase